MTSRFSRTTTSYLKSKGEFLYGLDPVLNALIAKKRIFHNIYLTDIDEKLIARTGKNKFAEIETLCKTLNIPLRRTDTNMLRSFIGDDKPHNGIIADCSILEPEFIKDIPILKIENDKPEVWVVFDDIQDPQNLGALLRSSLYFGAVGAILSRNRSSPLSPVVSKCSAGAMEVLPIYSCNSISKLLEKEKVVVGMSLDNDSKSLSALKTLDHKRWVVVVGNEGIGLKDSVRDKCTIKVKIEGMGGGSRKLNNQILHTIDSLNVSNALAILLFKLLGK